MRRFFTSTTLHHGLIFSGALILTWQGSVGMLAAYERAPVPLLVGVVTGRSSLPGPLLSLLLTWFIGGAVAGYLMRLTRPRVHLTDGAAGRWVLLAVVIGIGPILVVLGPWSTGAWLAAMAGTYYYFFVSAPPS
jgi:hypothetical protein